MIRNVIIVFFILVHLETYAQYCGAATTNIAITPTTTQQLSPIYNSGRRAFNFQATAGCTYVFETCGLSTVDTYLRLYSTATGGVVLAQDDDGCSTQSRIIWTANTTATVSILLTRFSCNTLNANAQLRYYIQSCAPPENTVPFTGNNSYTTCSGILYDHGGSASNYNNNANGFTVINPATAGTVIQLTGTINTESGYDFVTIYNGVGTGGVVLWSGSGNQNIGTVTSTSGPITVQFTSDGSVTAAGFALTINCVTLTTGPCNNSFAFAVENMPTQTNPVVTIACPGVGQFTDEYSQWQNGIAGISYITSSSIATDWITIRFGTPNGTVVAFGNSPLTWTATNTGTYYIHVNTNGFCGQDLNCRNITVQRISPLPITLLSYDVELRYDNVYIDWTTLSELNNDYYSVERSANAKDFDRIAIVKGAGTTTETNIYQYIDITPLTGISYYRIKQIDFDGTFTYTEIKSVNNSVHLLGQDVLIYPNPLRNQMLNIRVISVQDEDITIEIFDSKGKLVKQFGFNSKIGYNEIVFNMDRVSTGIYSVIIKSEINISNHILIISK
jgi:hypothetical protein